MPISSGAGGRRIGRDSTRPSAPMSAARSTPNLAQPPLGQGHPGSRMIDAPPRVETRRQLGSQTLYGSRPPWATDEDSPSPKKEQQTPPSQQPQPPFYPAGGDLLHGEAARMRRLKAARELYKSPHSRRKHNTGSVDDLLRDCAVSDHSHSPSPVRRAPSNASSLARSTPDLQAQREQRDRSTSRPEPTTRSTGVGTADGTSGSSPQQRRRHRNDGSIVSDDSLDNGDDKRKRVAADSGENRRSRKGQSRTSRGTSPPPPQKPLYVDIGCDSPDWAGAGTSPSVRQSFARSKMPAGLKPAAERKYVPPPPPPVRQPSPSVRRHDCLPSDNPPFRARPMPDFRRVSPSPGRNRSRSQSPAPQATLAPTSSAATSGYRSGGGSSPPRHHDHQRRRRRSMDEDSLTEAGSAGPGDRSVATEVLQPQRAPGDSRTAAADAVDSAQRNFEPTLAHIGRSIKLESPTGSCISQVGSSSESTWENCDSAASDQLIDELVAIASSAGVSQSELLSSSEATGPEPTRTAHTAEATRTTPPRDASGKPASSPCCHLCCKRVYPLEMLSWNDRIYHRSCFKCQACRLQLDVENFAMQDNRLYCPLHYVDLHRTKGGNESPQHGNGKVVDRELKVMATSRDEPEPSATVVDTAARADTGQNLSAAESLISIDTKEGLQQLERRRQQQQQQQQQQHQQQQQPSPLRRHRQRQQQQQIELLLQLQRHSERGISVAEAAKSEEIQEVQAESSTEDGEEASAAAGGLNGSGQHRVADRIRDLQLLSRQCPNPTANHDEALPVAGTTRSLLGLWREREARVGRQPSPPVEPLHPRRPQQASADAGGWRLAAPHHRTSHS